jgi:hypothetical protein
MEEKLNSLCIDVSNMHVKLLNEVRDLEVHGAAWKGNRSANRRARKKTVAIRQTLKELRKLLLEIEKEQSK